MRKAAHDAILLAAYIDHDVHEARVDVFLAAKRAKP